MRVPNSSTNHHLKENTPNTPAGVAGGVRVKPSAPSPNHGSDNKPLHPKIDPWDTNQVSSFYWLNYIPPSHIAICFVPQTREYSKYLQIVTYASKSQSISIVYQQVEIHSTVLPICMVDK